MRRKFTCVMLLIYTLCLCLPAPATAEANTHQRVDASTLCAWITTSYGTADFPADVLLALQENGLSNYAPENGDPLHPI